MAVTTEPGLRVQRSKDITLEDFLDAIDRIDPAQTPVMSMSDTEVELGAIDFKRNVDSFPTPQGAIGKADNEAAGTTSDISTGIRSIGNIAQAFARPWKIGWIASRVPKIAGVKDVESYARATYIAALKTDEEVAMSSFDQVAVYDQGSGLGAVGAGYLKLTDAANKYTAASAYAIGKPTDLHFAPSGACLTGTLTARPTRANLMGLAYALRVAAKANSDYMLVAGLSLRQQITNLTNPVYTNNSASASGSQAQSTDQMRVYLRNESDNVLGVSVDTIETDFGRLFVTSTDYIGTTTTDSSGNALSAVNTASGTGAGARGNAAFVSTPKKGIVIKKGNLFKRWGIAPFTEQLSQDGSGNTHETKALLAWGIRNPIRAGWLN